MGIMVALPIAAAIAICAKKRIEDFLFLAIGIIVTLIILTGLIGNTLVGVFISVLLGIISFLYCFYSFKKNRRLLDEYVLTPGLLSGLICFFITGVLFIGKTDLGYDNDTFWAHAPQIINMYRYSDIGTKGIRAGTFFLLYTAPVYTSWCYFCNRLWFDYSDGINLWARQIFFFSSLLPLFSDVKKGEWVKTALLSIIITLLPLMVDKSYNFMPDIPVAGAMAYGTIITIKLFRDKEKNNDKWYMLSVCIWLALLSLMKRVGGIYTYGIVGIATINTIDRIQNKKLSVGFLKKIMPMLWMLLAVCLTLVFSVPRSFFFRKDILYMFLPFACFALFVLLGFFCWIMKELANKKRLFLIVGLTVIVFSAIYAILNPIVGVISDWRHLDNNSVKTTEIFFTFISSWFTRSHYVGDRFGNGWVISDAIFILIILSTFLLIRLLIINGRIESRASIVHIDDVMAIIFSGYIVFMLFYCMVYMVYGEGYVLDGNIGYADRYFGPAVMLTTVIVIFELLNIVALWQNQILLFLIGILVLLNPVNPFSVLRVDNFDYWEMYHEVMDASGITIKEEDFFLCIGPDHCQYYVFPARSHLNYEIRRAEPSVDEWRDLMLTHWYYNYLLLEDYDTGFPEKYQELFEGGIGEIRKNTIYDVVIINGNDVRFVRRNSVSNK